MTTRILVNAPVLKLKYTFSNQNHKSATNQITASIVETARFNRKAIHKQPTVKREPQTLGIRRQRLLIIGYVRIMNGLNSHNWLLSVIHTVFGDLTDA